MKTLNVILITLVFFSLTPVALAMSLNILNYSSCEHIFGLISCNQQTEVCATNPDTGNPGCFLKSQVRYNVPYADSLTCVQQSNCPYACTLNSLAIPSVYFCNEPPPQPSSQPACVTGKVCTTSSGVSGTCSFLGDGTPVCQPTTTNGKNGGNLSPGTGGSGNLPPGIGPIQNSGTSITLINPLGSGATLNSFLTSILDIVIQVGTVVIILMLVYVGFLFVIARGNPGEVTKARDALLWTVIGALILLGAKAIAVGIQATVQALSVGR